jgi:electron transport complex protein RnfG
LNFLDKKYSAKIEVQKENMLLKEMKKLIPEGERFDLYEDSKYYDGFLFIPTYKGDKKIAYIVKGISRGYSEKDIEFLLALDLKGVTLGHKIINHQETLGLGSKISEKEYEDLWKGKDINSKFIKGIDSVNGETYTFLNF